MMLKERIDPATVDEDHKALAAACEPGVGLCTIVGIDGSFSRRLGAQMAVRPDGSTVGSLADGCLETQLATDIGELDRPQIVRYGHGSSKIDFRLPCGGGLDIMLDPAPDREACRAAMEALTQRRQVHLPLPAISPIRQRNYIPALNIFAFGEGPELECLHRLATAMNLAIEVREKNQLHLGQPAEALHFDPWSAVILLFHDHEWEIPLLEQALASEAFYIGAQGGENARIDRVLKLTARGVSETHVARVKSPVGLIPVCKTPDTLALSALAEIAGQYEKLRAAA